MTEGPADWSDDDLGNSRVLLTWETLLGPPPEWYVVAACRETGVRDWFGGTRAAARAARSTCARCPARVECLDYALEHVELVGIWGGSSFDERSRIRSERRRADNLVRPARS